MKIMNNNLPAAHVEPVLASPVTPGLVSTSTVIVPVPVTTRSKAGHTLLPGGGIQHPRGCLCHKTD